MYLFIEYKLKFVFPIIVKLSAHDTLILSQPVCTPLPLR